MLLGGLLEFFLGDTFSWVVFSSFAAYWMIYGATLTSQFDAFTNYATAQETSDSGAESPVFQGAFGFFLVFMGLLCLIYLVCSIRTNVIFFIIFLVLVPSFGCFSAAVSYILSFSCIFVLLLEPPSGWYTRIFALRPFSLISSRTQANERPQFWWNSNGNFSYSLTLLKIGGAGFFVVAMCGWYLFAVQVLASVDLINLPVGDLRYVSPESCISALTC